MGAHSLQSFSYGLARRFRVTHTQLESHREFANLLSWIVPLYFQGSKNVEAGASLGSVTDAQDRC